MQPARGVPYKGGTISRTRPAEPKWRLAERPRQGDRSRSPKPLPSPNRGPVLLPPRCRARFELWAAQGSAAHPVACTEQAQA